jgi:hypothetical protein
MRKDRAQINGLYVLLFAVSSAGFIYHFADFAKSNFDQYFTGSVAGAKVEKTPLRVEIRGNDKAKVTKVFEDLSKNTNVEVINISYTSKIYDSDLLIDVSKGTKVGEVSSLENHTKLGAQSVLPEDERGSLADVLIIVSK